MADEVQIKFGADIGGAISALNTLKQAVTGAAEPVARFKNAFVDAGAAVQSSGAAALAAFRADMQRMVAERAISLRQAIGFDIEYAAQRSDQERVHFDRVLASDAATLAEKSESYGALVELSGRYEAELAQDQRRLAEAARREADRMAQPYRQAFDAIGAGWRSVVIGLVEGTLSFRTAALGVAQSVERGFISMAQTTLSRAAAGPLSSLLGVAGPAAGEGVGDVLGNAASRWISGAPQQLGGAAAGAANIAALAANTAALGAMTASLGVSAAAGGAGALGVPRRSPAARPSSGRPRAGSACSACSAPSSPSRAAASCPRRRAAGPCRAFPARRRRSSMPARWCCRRRSARACRA